MKKRLGVTAPPAIAEKMIRALKRLQLIDSKFKLSRTDQCIMIPITRAPSEQEACRIREQCGFLRVEPNLFVEAKTKPRDLREAVSNQIPEPLISKIPRAFDIIGEIAVVELPREIEEYSAAVGNGILSTNPRLRLVLRKSGDISGTFRTYNFEVVAGLGSTETIHREFSSRFHLDVARVYFNPRLSTERMRVATQLRKGECIVDMFAGVGPYSILMARVQPDSAIYSIEINSEAFKYLKENTLLNDVADRVVPILGDARKVSRQQLTGVADRIVMNHPSEAGGFLDSALRTLKKEGGVIHYYAFASRDEGIDRIVNSVQATIENNRRRVESFAFAKAIKEVAPNRVQVAIDAIVK